MPYATQADLELAFGRDNIRAWSNLDNTSANADADRIAAALAWADEYLHSRLRGGRYALPLTPTAGGLAQVVEWASSLAAWKLYTARGLRDEDGLGHKLGLHRERVDRELDALLHGRITLAAQVAISSPDGPVVF
ncbi:MAG: DUF1320 family protein [Planctomycetota bacterium]|nr:DUF1320 family protein [Planctomycetota bacterium]